MPAILRSYTVSRNAAAQSLAPETTISRSTRLGVRRPKAFDAFRRTIPVARTTHSQLRSDARRIIEWATYVIQGDPDRPLDRPFLRCADGSPDGEVALLAFPGDVTEATGVADLVQHLIRDEGVEPESILILLRGDHNGTFSRPIKEALDEREIEYSDPT